MNKKYLSNRIKKIANEELKFQKIDEKDGSNVVIDGYNNYFHKGKEFILSIAEDLSKKKTIVIFSFLSHLIIPLKNSNGLTKIQDTYEIDLNTNILMKIAFLINSLIPKISERVGIALNKFLHTNQIKRTSFFYYKRYIVILKFNIVPKMANNGIMRQFVALRINFIKRNVFDSLKDELIKVGILEKTDNVKKANQK